MILRSHDIELNMRPMRHSKHVLALAGAAALGTATPTQALPVLPSKAAIEAAIPANVVDVRWGRWGVWRGGWWGPRAPIGLGIGGPIVLPLYGGPYWGGPYWAGPYWGGYWGQRSSICWDRGRRVACNPAP
jgi:hypothetical protein